MLAVRNLSVSFDTPDGTVEAVRGVSFDVKEARTLGIVGESGSGKSVTTQAIVGAIIGWDLFAGALIDFGALEKVVLSWFIRYYFLCQGIDNNNRINGLNNISFKLSITC